jgi:hypothetical protein
MAGCTVPWSPGSPRPVKGNPVMTVMRRHTVSRKGGLPGLKPRPTGAPRRQVRKRAAPAPEGGAAWRNGPGSRGSRVRPSNLSVRPVLEREPDVSANHARRLEVLVLVEQVEHVHPEEEAKRSQAEAVADRQIRPRQRRRPAVAHRSQALEREGAAGDGGRTRHRDAAGLLLFEAEQRAERQLLVRPHLELVRTVGGRAAEDDSAAPITGVDLVAVDVEPADVIECTGRSACSRGGRRPRRA